MLIEAVASVATNEERAIAFNYAGMAFVDLRSLFAIRGDKGISIATLCDKGIGIATLAVLHKTRFQMGKCRGTSVQRHPQCRSFSSYVQNIRCTHRLIEMAICQVNRHSPSVSQRVRVYRSRARNQSDRV